MTLGCRQSAIKAILLSTFLGTLLVAKVPALAQNSHTQVDSSADEVESLYDQLDQKAEQANPPPKAVQKQLPKVTTLSDLGNLAPFSDIAVIQRRFLPKTNRFELSLLGFTNLNNPFFNNLGVTAKGAYFFNEKWGFELVYKAISASRRQVTDDLQKNQSIDTASLVSAKSFMGAAIDWNPIYGKVSFLNKSIVPFDFTFHAGFGTTKTDQNQQEPTIYLGTSQVFALSKDWAFRWDIDWNFYNARAKDSTGVAKTVSQSDLFLGVGVSFYFPDAGYR